MQLPIDGQTQTVASFSKILRTMSTAIYWQLSVTIPSFIDVVLAVKQIIYISDILLRKHPPAITASFFERMKFIIEDKGMQSYVEGPGFNER